MSRRSRSRLRLSEKRTKAMVDINVIPYIDVMLVLLVIFMITAPILTQGVHVDLPKTEAKSMLSKPEKPIIVTVNKAGQYFLNRGKLPDTSLSAGMLVRAVEAIKAKSPKTNTYVRADKLATYGNVVQAMVLLQKANIDHVGLITDGFSQK